MKMEFTFNFLNKLSNNHLFMSAYCVLFGFLINHNKISGFLILNTINGFFLKNTCYSKNNAYIWILFIMSLNKYV